MKPSKYNYIIPLENSTAFFNGISEVFFIAPNERVQTYREILENPNLYIDDFQVFISAMKNGGFLLDENEDEQERLMKKYHSIRRSSELFIMILPTYECNLRCWYCIQCHEGVGITPEVINNLKQFADKHLDQTRIKTCTLSWFGGEPMMKYDEVLEYTHFLQNLCDERGIIMHTSITTNATLLSKERIDALTSIGEVSFQISIDGPKQMHDKVKRLPDESAYDKVLDLINYMAKKIHLTLRFNYTHKTLQPVTILSELAERIEPASRKNINFLIYKVWQERKENIDQTKVAELFDGAAKLGFTPRLAETNLCYADYENFFCVFPNGKMAKCDNHGIHTAPGQLMPNGEINWPKGLGYDIPPIELPTNECTTCKYLPCCWGPCPSKRESMLAQDKYIHCFMSDRESEMHNNIRHNILNRITLEKQKRSLAGTPDDAHNIHP